MVSYIIVKTNLYINYFSTQQASQCRKSFNFLQSYTIINHQNWLPRKYILRILLGTSLNYQFHKFPKKLADIRNCGQGILQLEIYVWRDHQFAV